MVKEGLEDLLFVSKHDGDPEGTPSYFFDNADPAMEASVRRGGLFSGVNINYDLVSNFVIMKQV